MEGFDAACGVVLCCDFDGTLAPIVDDPSEATPLPETQAALQSLTTYSTVEVSVVSGRAVNDVRDRVAVEGIAYAGNHGLELIREGELTVHPIAAKRRSTVKELVHAIEAAIQPIEGAFVENKGVTATVHYRQSSAADTTKVRHAVANSVEAYGTDIRVTEGKQIHEIRPDIPWDKGSAVRLFAGEAPRSWIPAYIGDDTTDEDAFHSVIAEGGVAIHVGDIDTSAADYQVADPDEVATFLGTLETRLADNDGDEGDVSEG